MFIQINLYASFTQEDIYNLNTPIYKFIVVIIIHIQTFNLYEFVYKINHLPVPFPKNEYVAFFSLQHKSYQNTHTINKMEKDSMMPLNPCCNNNGSKDQ